MKKPLSILMALLLVFSLLSTTALASQPDAVTTVLIQVGSTIITKIQKY